MAKVKENSGSAAEVKRNPRSVTEGKEIQVVKQSSRGIPVA
ncbi:hypothetical protein SAMN05216391_11127 [Lachnospiraceae bacterium KHCPX20]|nr:hypothetical protein SAMN05216391_11127 [Lachnospiraceae bacterium KHCPX20]